MTVKGVLPEQERHKMIQDPESGRLEEAPIAKTPWRKWGPYLSERQWGTVREDNSQNGNAWDCFTHDQARSGAYHWGEDGRAGISDDKQLLCFSVALWNAHRRKVRSIVGLLPLCATTVVEPWQRERVPRASI
jgi:hypothetical protein